MDKEEKQKLKEKKEQRKEELAAKTVLAKSTKKMDMTPEQLAFYKRGSKKGRRKSFLIRSAVKCGLLAGIAFGGYKAYQYVTKTYSPMVIEKTKSALDLAGGYLYNYVYYKSAYALESGKAQAMSVAIEQILDKYDEMKQQLEDAQSQVPENPTESSDETSNAHYTFQPRSLDENEKVASANFIVGLYNNKETSKFDIQTIQWGDTFNLDVTTTHENGEHQLTLSLAASEGTMEEGRKVFGTEPVEFNGDMYNKFGINGIKSAVNLITNVVGGLDSAIYGIGIDGNTVTMEQMTNFFKEEDCLEYLKDAGLDLGVDTERIEDTINGESEENTEEPGEGEEPTEPNEEETEEEVEPIVG